MRIHRAFTALLVTLLLPTALAESPQIYLAASDTRCEWSPVTWVYGLPGDPRLPDRECYVAHDFTLTVACGETCAFRFEGASEGRGGLPAAHLYAKAIVLSESENGSAWIVDRVCESYGIDVSCSYDWTITFPIPPGKCVLAGISTKYHSGAWNYRAGVATAAEACRAEDGTVSLTPYRP